MNFSLYFGTPVTDKEMRVVNLVEGSLAELHTSYQEESSPVHSHSNDSETASNSESQLAGVDAPTEMSTFAAL